MSNPENNKPETNEPETNKSENKSKTDKPNKSETKSISEKLENLNSKIDWFYSDDFSLDEATEKYKEAIALANETEEDLKNLKNEIEVLSKDFSKN